MTLKALNSEDEKRYRLFVRDWQQSGENRLTPFSANLNGLTYPQWLEKLQEDKQNSNHSFVPAETLFLEKEDNLVGAVQLRYQLNEKLLELGGNIGYGIAPSERGKGYANEVLKQSLAIFKERGHSKVLLTCDKENEPSKITIIRNGGTLENEKVIDGKLIQRYWINL